LLRTVAAARAGLQEQLRTVAAARAGLQEHPLRTVAAAARAAHRSVVARLEGQPHTAAGVQVVHPERPSAVEVAAHLSSVAERRASPYHRSLVVERAEHRAYPGHSSLEAAQLARHQMTEASESRQAANTLEELAMVVERACPWSMATSAAQSPARLPRYAAHREMACAGCSCAAEHIASSTH